MRNTLHKITALVLSLCLITGTGLPVTAFGSEFNDAEVVAADKESLEIGFSVGDSVYGVTDDLTLPLTGISGSAIAWLSDTPGVIANDGAVSRPAADAGDTEVTLTAAITYGEAGDTRDFVVTVLKETAPPPGDEAEKDEIIPEIGAPHAGENGAEEFLSMGDAAPAYEEPPDLEMVAHTATTVTMTANDGAEYIARDYLMRPIGEWQDSNVLTGLEPNTSYLILARWKGTSISSSRVVKTDKAVLGGSVYIDGTRVFGHTLTADISLLRTNPADLPFGTLSYRWMRSGADIAYATESTYTLTAADIGHTIRVRVTAENCYGEINSVAEYFTVEKAPQAKPPVPSAAFKTATSITLNTAEGAEYRGAGRDWQDSPTFSGLTPDTTYTFFVRMKESATHKESDTAFGPLTTEKAALVGTVSVSGGHVYGETLTAVTGAFSTDPNGYATGEISYQWTRDGGDIAGAAGTSYTLTAEDVGKVINLRVTATNCQSPIASDNTSAVAKATQDTLSPPILDFAEDTSITLGNITGAEYKCGEGEWQDSRTFTGLTPSTEYTFYARMKETATHYASASSGPSVLQTLKAVQPAPDPPTVSLVSVTDVKFVQITNAQYRMGGGAWRDIGSFSGLQPNTTYTFSMRMKETTTHQASPPSAPVTVTTLKRTQHAVPNPPTLLSKTATSITLNSIAGAEYSKDGTVWQDSPVFSGLTPDTGYTFYARLKETSEYYASSPSEASDMITTDKAALSGSVSISGSHVFGQELTAVTSSLIIDPADAVIGTLSFQWTRDGAEIAGATASAYTLVSEDVGMVINVTVSSEYCTGEVISTNSSAVAKAGQTAPNPPTAVSVIATGVTLTAIPGAQYRLGTGDWQENPEFTGLTPGTEYTFYARLKETATHQASPVSAPAAVTTLKHSQAAPSAPTPLSKTATGITLNVIANAEYSKDGTDWQDSPVFSGLTPNTGYTFYARLKETSEYYASPPSAASGMITTDKAALSGSISVNGAYSFGQTLTAVTDTLSADPAGADTGALSYQWTRDGAEIAGAAGDTYTLGAEDIGAVVNVTVTAEHCTGAVSSANSSPVTKAASAAPTVEVSEKTTTSVMLAAIPGAQYFCGTTALTPEKTADGWQSSPEFTGLSPNTAYYFFVYLEETGTHLASPVSTGVAATTNKAPMTGTASITGTLKYGETLTVNITGITGTFTCTWYRSGDSAPIHTGGAYQVIQADIGRTLRAEVSAAGYGGKLTSADTAVIAKAVQAPPTLAYTRSGDYETTGVTVTITSPAGGAAYSFDGSTYGAANSHTYAQGVIGATVYARLEETATHLQSAAASLALDFTKQNQATPIVTLSATADEAAVTLHISATGGQSGSYAYKIDGGSYADLPDDGNAVLTMAGETVVVSVRDKGDAYYNPSPDAAQTVALPKYLNFTTVTVSTANFTKTQTSITMSAAPVAGNGGEMEYSFDGGAYVTLNTNDLPAFTGLSAGSSHTITIRVKGNAQREAGVPASVTIQTVMAGGGNSSSGGGAVARTSVISDVAQTAGDKAMDEALIEKDQALLPLAGSSNAAQISAAVITRLAEHKIPFTAETAGLSLDFAPGTLSVPQVTGQALVELRAREITGTEKEAILAQIPAGQSTGLFEIGGRIFDLSALVQTGSGEGQRIEKFGAPVAVTIDLSHLGDLTPAQIGQLTGVRLEKDDQGNIVPVNLGGKYDPATKTFTMYTDTFSLYTVMRAEQGVTQLVVELAAGSASASVNGSPHILDAPPLIAEGRTLVPLRFIGEALGAEVTWDAAARQITVEDTGREIILIVGSAAATVNGSPYTLDAPPLITGGRALAPLRFIGEALGAKVHYDAATKGIAITR